MARLVRWTALTAAAALLTAGCSGGSSDEDKDDGGRSSAGPSAAAPSGVPEALASQTLDWARCEGTDDAPAPDGDWRCATLKAPLDWSDPDGETIDLALIRSRASGDDRIGSLLFNFGGPGASGVSTMPSYADTVSSLHERYDLVSWDPRGVAASEGVRCRTDEAIEAAESVDSTPDSPAEEQAYLKDAADFGRGCEKAHAASSWNTSRPRTRPATWT